MTAVVYGLDTKIWLQKNDGLGHAVDEFLLGKYSKTEMKKKHKQYPLICRLSEKDYVFVLIPRPSQYDSDRK